LHRLLERQLRKYLKGESPEELMPFLGAVDAAYCDLDHDKKFIENTLEISLKELDALNANLQSKQKELQSALNVILDSIDYATRLQQGQLPDIHKVKSRFSQLEVYWQPRDQIGGDFWWVSPVGPSGKFNIIAVDCTGHGVPGAMLALLASNLLGQIYSIDVDFEPVEVLMKLDELMRLGLNQKIDGSIGNDGCDAAIVQIDPNSHTIIYSGCGIDLYEIGRSGIVQRHNSSNISLGYPVLPSKAPEQIIINLEPDQVFLMSSDGILDQIGISPLGRKMSFGSTRFKIALENTLRRDCQELIENIIQEMNVWRGREQVRDDQMILAFAPLTL